MPRPTRTRDWRAPLLSLISFSFIMHSLSLLSRRSMWTKRLGVLDAHQMLHLADLAEHFGRALHFHAAVQLVETEADQRRPLRLVAADRRAGLGNLEFLCLGHFTYSAIASAWASASAALAPPRPRRSATFLPRRCATERGLD